VNKGHSGITHSMDEFGTKTISLCGLHDKSDARS
jgi:hypothetical protein